MEKEGRWDDGRPGRFRLDKSKPLLINKGWLAGWLACLLACQTTSFVLTVSS